MNPYSYLNYFIYSFYQGKDADPFIYAMNGSALLVTMNMLQLIWILEATTPFRSIEKVSVIILLLLVTVNYLFLYRKGRHEVVFAALELRDTTQKKVLCLTYIIVTLLTTFGGIALVRYYKFGSL